MVMRYGQNPYGTANSEHAFDMGLRNDGHIYLTGIADPDDKGFIKKIDLNGNEIWTKFFGNANWDLYGNPLYDQYIFLERQGEI